MQMAPSRVRSRFDNLGFLPASLISSPDLNTWNMQSNLIFSMLSVLLAPGAGCTQKVKKSVPRPDPVTNAGSDLMLEGNWLPDHTSDIDFDALIKIPLQRVIVIDVSESSGVKPTQLPGASFG